jgi:hypothetical protein
MTFLRQQQRYERNAYTAEPEKERDVKSGNDVYKSVYSSIAPLVLVDGRTPLVIVNLIFVRVIVFVFTFMIVVVIIFVFIFDLEFIDVTLVLIFVFVFVLHIS